MEDSTNFAFCFNGETGAHPSLSADVLFYGGKIRPLKLLTRSAYQHIVRYSPDQSPRSPKRMLTKSFLVSPPRHNQKSTDSPLLITPAKKQQGLSSSYFTADNSKLILESTLEKQTSKDTTCSNLFSSNSSSSSSSTNRSIMWKLLDLLMMCGCSENVANKVDESASMMRSSYKKDTNEWSFRSDNSSSKSTGSGGSSRKGSSASVSAHEWHYKKKRAAAEEMRRKTFLPYKKSLLGCMDHVDVDTGTVLEFYRGQRVVEITC